MKYFLIFSFIILSESFLVAQEYKEHKIRLSTVEEMKVDSIVKCNSQNIRRSEENGAYKPEQLKNPVKAVQSYMFFNTFNWGKSILTQEYQKDFLNKILIDYRNSKEYINNAYVKVYFIIYFKYLDKEYASCLIDCYASEKHPIYSTFLTLINQDKKWSVTSDDYLKKIEQIAILKPDYALNLLLGNNLANNKKYNELFNKVYNSGNLDLGVFEDLLIEKKIVINKSEKEEYYSELINKNSDIYILHHPISH